MPWYIKVQDIQLQIREKQLHVSAPEVKELSLFALEALQPQPALFQIEGGINPVAERALLRKLDLTFLPLFTLIYCVVCIGRSTIEYAKGHGIGQDLEMVGPDYNVAFTVFYILSLTFVIPSNLALKCFGSNWLAFLLVAFGAASMGAAFVGSDSGLVTARVFQGVAEGGILPGLTYILSRYYRRTEFVLRVGIFLGLAPQIARACEGFLSSGLLATGDIGGVTSWRKLFLVEGIVAAGLGVLCIVVVPADPRFTRMLSRDKRKLALERVAADQVVSTSGRRERTSLRLIFRALNLNTTLCAAAYLMINLSAQSISIFMPTVVDTLGNFTTNQSRLHAVPPYLVGAAWALLTAYCSYRSRQRAVPIALSALLMVLGYALLLGTHSPHARYAACFLAVAGGAASAPLFLSWAVDNAAPDTVRAVTIAIVTGAGSAGSLIAVWAYPSSGVPDYRLGTVLNLAACSVVFATAVAGFLYARWENAQRESGERDWRLDGLCIEEIGELGHLHPEFRYQT